VEVLDCRTIDRPVLMNKLYDVRCQTVPMIFVRNSQDRIVQRQVAYSLSPPRLTSETVPGHERQRETLRDLGLHEDRCALIALVGILFIDSGVMLLRIVTAFENGAEQLADLTQCVARVMNMCLGLLRVSKGKTRCYGR
jgi:hypothetical protein